MSRVASVLPVHDHVHSEVQGDRNPRNGSVSNKLSVAEQGSGAMMIGVKESKWLLLENQEDSVNEFEVLGEVVQLGELDNCTRQVGPDGTHVVECNQFFSPAAVVTANCVEDTIANQSWEELLNEEHQ